MVCWSELKHWKLCQNSYTRGLSTCLPACKRFITQKDNLFLVHEYTGENVASLSGWRQSSRPKPHQSAIIWNPETLTGIWGIFTNEASGQEAHEDSWRKEMKWKTIKWIMASLHTHPSQWRGGKKDPCSPQQAQHRVKCLQDWSDETEAPHKRMLHGFPGRSVCIFGKLNS